MKFNIGNRVKIIKALISDGGRYVEPGTEAFIIDILNDTEYVVEILGFEPGQLFPVFDICVATYEDFDKP